MKVIVEKLQQIFQASHIFRYDEIRHGTPFAIGTGQRQSPAFAIPFREHPATENIQVQLIHNILFLLVFLMPHSIASPLARQQ